MKADFKPEKKEIYANGVKYDANDEYIELIQVLYFHIEDKTASDCWPTREDTFNREELLWLIDGGYTIYIMPPTPESIGPESEIVRYDHPENGKIYVTTRGVMRGRDNLDALPKIK